MHVLIPKSRRTRKIQNASKKGIKWIYVGKANWILAPLQRSFSGRGSVPSPWVHRAPLVALHLLPAKASEEPRPLRHLPGGCQQRWSEHLLWQVPNSILNMLNQIIANICKSCSKICQSKDHVEALAIPFQPQKITPAPTNSPNLDAAAKPATTIIDTNTLSGGGMLLRSWLPGLWVQTHLIHRYRSGLCSSRHSTEQCWPCPPKHRVFVGVKGCASNCCKSSDRTTCEEKMTSWSVSYIYNYIYILLLYHVVPVPFQQTNWALPEVSKMFALSIIRCQLKGVTCHAHSQIYLCLLMSHRRNNIASSINTNIIKCIHTDIVLVHSILYIVKTHPITWCCSIQIVLHSCHTKFKVN